MAGTQQALSSEENAAAGGRELGFRIALCCPKCSATGWIEWQHLKHGLRCSKCSCHFLVTPTGQVRAQAELPQVRFTCPRCHRSGSIPDLLTIGGAECLSCRLPLVRGPDQRLHGLDEARELRRAASERQGKPSAAAEWFTWPNGSLRLGRVAWVAALTLGALLAGGLWLHTWFDVTPATLARRFTYVCLSGRWDRAEDFLDDDPVQRAEFDRWRLRYFSSILDKHRPKGDSVEIEVEPLRESADALDYRVKLTSPFLGTRTLGQSWRLVQGEWRFDARVTLAEDGAAHRGPPAGRRAERKAPQPSEATKAAPSPVADPRGATMPLRSAGRFATRP